MNALLVYCALVVDVFVAAYADMRTALRPRWTSYFLNEFAPSSSP